MKRKIGIVSCYDTYNYGSRLQSFALQKAIEIMGYDSEIIKYSRSKDFQELFFEKILRIENIFNVSWWNSKLNKKNTNVKYEKAIIEKKKERLKALDEFSYNKMFFSVNKGTRQELNRCVDDYDIFVAGSDQIWNPCNISSPYNMMSFVSKDKYKFSYASSFGVGKIPVKLYPLYVKYLKGFNNISVREESGAQIIKKLLGRTATIVVDPTLLLDVAEWNHLEAESSYILPEHKYAFAYFLGENIKQRKLVKKISEEKGVYLIDFPHLIGVNTSDGEYSDSEVYNANPQDMLRIIKHAEYIFTDSFHVTIFSFLFKRKVLTFARYADKDKNSTNSRLLTLFNYFCPEDKLLYGDEGTLECIKNLEQQQVSHERWLKAKMFSLRYLQTNIENGFMKQNS